MSIKCFLCKSTDTKPFFENFSYFKCKNCGFVFANNKTKANRFVYGEEYFHIEDFKYKSIGYRSYEKDQDHHKFYFRNKIRLIARYLKTGKILDVGCALGYFMEVAKEYGYYPYGIDVSNYAVNYAQKRFSGKVYLADKACFKPNYFDGITLFQTLEHLSDPNKTLNELKKWLKKDGYLFIATPNSNCWMRIILGKYWFEFKPAEHLSLFNNDSVRFLLEKNGFKIVQIANDYFYYPIGYIFERIAYYTRIKFFNKIKINSSVRFPLPLGGMIIVAKKI